MATLHLISHTHWDREWYQPFQVYRLKLVDLIDNLINIIRRDNGYAHFMLDGQTITLDDYLAVRPQNEDVLRQLIKSGRIIIGPWHILPDEFLVSPEATIRNLLQGARTSRRFGGRMPVGYIPDPFGHIAQLPQILLGFDIKTACFQRGLSVEPCELLWEAPDGSRVLTSFLRDGYGNAAYLALEDPNLCLQQIQILKASLQQFSASSHLLLMQGTDHTWPEAATPKAICSLNSRLEGDTVIHSSLPEYFKAVKAELGNKVEDLPVIRGCLRDSRKSPLLPGVLSTRMWIKQHNQSCQDLLEKWVEPFCTLAEMHARENSLPEPILNGGSADLIRTAWRQLMECHPHDSICGCSIDQVHAEMKPRFDQVEQIGEELTGRALSYLAGQVNTSGTEPMNVVVFNPHNFEHTDLVKCTVSLPEYIKVWSAVDENGMHHPVRALNRIPGSRETIILSRVEWLLAAGRLQSGEFSGQRISSGRIIQKDSNIELELVLNSQPLDPRSLEEIILLRDWLVINPPEFLTVHLVQQAHVVVEFLAENVPGLGWRTFNLVPTATKDTLSKNPNLENEYFRITLSRENLGSLDILDKLTGTIYTNTHTFTSGGDCGDEYNFCPPTDDSIIHSELISSRVDAIDTGSEMILEYELNAPARITPDRSSRSSELRTIRIQSCISLPAQVPRIDIHSTVWNECSDYRLRVHFPAPFKSRNSWSDGHFEIYQHSALPAYDETWIEQPRPETYQRAFTTISDGIIGLTIANRGLPEVEVVQGSDRTEIALTLLRCVGWLSREDLTVRKGNAGPGLETPQAQMQGRWEFDYSIIPHPQGWLESYQKAYAFVTPFRASQTYSHDGVLPSTGQFFRVAPAAFQITTIKEAEDGSGIIMRGYNMQGESINASIACRYAFKTISQARLDEEILAPLQTDDTGSVIMAMRNKAITTLHSSNHDRRPVGSQQME